MCESLAEYQCTKRYRNIRFTRRSRKMNPRRASLATARQRYLIHKPRLQETDEVHRHVERDRDEGVEQQHVVEHLGEEDSCELIRPVFPTQVALLVQVLRGLDSRDASELEQASRVTSGIRTVAHSKVLRFESRAARVPTRASSAQAQAKL